MTPSEVADKALAEAGFSPTNKARGVWHRSKGPEEQDDVVEFHYHAPSKWFKAELYGKVEDLSRLLNPISLEDVLIAFRQTMVDHSGEKLDAFDGGVMEVEFLSRLQPPRR